MAYQTEALITQFSTGTGRGYEITFQAEAPPNYPKHFTRHYQKGDKELESLKRHIGVSAAPEIAMAQARVPVMYDGNWHLNI